MIKKFFIFATLVCFTQFATANSSQLLGSYSDLLHAISQGDSIRAIMYVNKCSMTSTSMKVDDVIAGMNFSDFNKYPVSVGNIQKNTIATSIYKLVEHPIFGPIYNYVRLRIFEDNSAEIFSEYLDPRTYKQLGSMTANCAVSNGHDQNGIMLYHV